MGVDSAIAVAGLIATLDKVEGRKRLQKLVHLLQEGGAREFQYRFILHYFGPFSRELANDLDFLCQTRLLDQAEPAGGEGSYKYSPRTPEIGGRILALLAEGGDEPHWAPRARELNELDTGLLEALSTVVFLAKRGYVGEALREKFGQTKPHLGRQFDEAVEFGGGLRLLPA